jgi:hypothetical protein
MGAVPHVRKLCLDGFKEAGDFRNIDQRTYSILLATGGRQAVASGGNKQSYETSGDAASTDRRIETWT